MSKEETAVVRWSFALQNADSVFRDESVWS